MINLERNTDEIFIKKIDNNHYIKFDKINNMRYRQDSEELANILKSSESSPIENEDDKYVKKKYIFVRLYDPTYKGLTPANVLKRGQQITEVNKINGSHVAINYNLKDKFWGLTGLKEGNDFAIESCEHPETNGYMNGCDTNKSTCIVLYYACDEQDYSKCKNLILKYARNNTLSYNTASNFIMAIRQIKRKWFTPKNKQIIGKESDNVEILSYESLKNENKEKIQTKFVCSTLVAYLLYTTITPIKRWFDNHGINHNHITPSDISAIRGMKFGFKCKWNEYNKTLNEFCKKHPEFNEYK